MLLERDFDFSALPFYFILLNSFKSWNQIILFILDF